MQSVYERRVARPHARTYTNRALDPRRPPWCACMATPTGDSCSRAAPSDVPVSTEENEAPRTGKLRRWMDKLRRKIMGAVRPSSRRAAPVEEPPRRDVDDAEKRRLRREMKEVFRLLDHDGERQMLEQELVRCQATQCGSEESGGQALQTKCSTPTDDVNGVAEDVNPDADGSPDKGVLPEAAGTEETDSPTLVVELPKMVPAAFLTPVTNADAEDSQDGAGSSMPISDSDLVERWSELIQIAECQATERRSLRPGARALHVDNGPNDVNGVAEDAKLDACPEKGVLSAAAAAEEIESHPSLVEPQFPVRALDKQPKSVRTFRPKKVPLPPSPTRVIATAEKSQNGEGSSTPPINRNLVDRWSKMKEIVERQARRRQSLRLGKQAEPNDDVSLDAS
jgi:hypothetical protein